METTLCQHDQNVIRDIVKHFSSGERVRVLRKMFGSDCSFKHFIFLGEEICLEKMRDKDNENWRLVSRMRALAIN